MTDVEDTRDPKDTRDPRQRTAPARRVDWHGVRFDDGVKQWMVTTGALTMPFLGATLAENLQPIMLSNDQKQRICEVYNAAMNAAADTDPAPTYRGFEAAMKRFEQEEFAGQLSFLEERLRTPVVEACAQYRIEVVQRNLMQRLQAQAASAGAERRR